MNGITVYSTSWCGDCKRAKKWLEEHNISYKEIDIEKVPGAKEEMMQINGNLQHIPTIVFPDGKFLIEPTTPQLAKYLLKI